MPVLYGAGSIPAYLHHINICEVKQMCTKICDCNNCFKNKTCTSCVFQSEVISKKEINCQRDGIQGCPYKVKFPHKNKEN